MLVEHKLEHLAVVAGKVDIDALAQSTRAIPRKSRPVGVGQNQLHDFAAAGGDHLFADTPHRQHLTRSA